MTKTATMTNARRSSLTITAKNANELHIRVHGRFDFRVARAFRDAYEGRSRLERYVVDLSDSESLTGSALGMLVVLREWLEEHGDPFIELRGVSERFSALLEMSRLSRSFQLQECVA